MLFPVSRTLIALLLLLAACLTFPDSQDGEESTARWWRGNTHTHTLWSDGDGAPELVADRYREAGYHFLVLSDHNVLSTGERWFPIDAEDRLTPARVEELRERFGPESVRIRERDGIHEMRLATLDELRARFEREGEFLFLQGEELTDSFDEAPVHVNGVNLAELIPPQGGATLFETLQRNVDAVIEQGRRLGRPTLAHVNHPNFGWALSWRDIARLEGESFFEVYNGHPSTREAGDAEHEGTDEMWDLALAERLGRTGLGPLFGLATDDAHHYHADGGDLANMERGWVMVRAAELTPDAIVGALLAGDFYSSSGVTLREVKDSHDRYANARYTVDIEAEPGVTYTTRFIGTREGGAVGELLLETRANPAEYELAGDELYVRAVVTSSRPHPNPAAAGDFEKAWTQPLVRTSR